MRRFIPLSLFAALAVGSSASALAVTTSVPVRVSSCIVYARDASGRMMTLTPNVTLTDGVQVTLVNDSTKTTKSVTVTGNYHGRVVTDSANVELKPGGSVSILRSYYPPSTYVDANAQCSVVKTVFTDGTIWNASP